MVELTRRNEELRVRLQRIVTGLRQIVKPYIGQVYPMYENIDKALKRLDSTKPVIKVGIYGAFGSGKSTLMSALCGHELFPRGNRSEIGDNETYADVSLRHVAGQEPVLVVQAVARSKTIGAGASAIYEWLKDENERWREQSKKPHYRRSTPPLGSLPFDPMRVEVEMPSFGDASHSEMEIHFTEVPPTYKGAAHLSKSQQTSITDKWRTVESTIACDAVFYVIDYTVLKGEREQNLFVEIQDALNPKLLHYMKDRIFFIINKADEQVYLKTGAESIAEPAFTSVQETKSYVSHFVQQRLGFEPKDGQIVVCSALQGLYCRLIARDPHPTIARLYNFCECTKGSLYMQTIDATPEHDLRSAARLTCGEIEQETGIHSVDALLRIIDQNGGRVYLGSILGGLQHDLAQYQSVLDQAIPILKEESNMKADEKHSLEQELEFILDRFHMITSAVQTMRMEMTSSFDVAWHDFWVQRLDEVERIFNGEGVFDFPTRQETAVYTIAKELKHFRDFVPRYVKDRVFLEATVAAKDNHYQRIREDDPGFRKFVHSQPGDILCALEKERAEKAVFFNIAVAHHIKDEFEWFCPRVEEFLLERRNDILELICHDDASREMWSRAERANGRAFDINRLEEVLTEGTFLDPDDVRALNNAVREIPEEVVGVMVDLQTGPDGEELGKALVRSWRIFANRVSPHRMLAFRDEALAVSINAALDMITGFVGEYVQKLRDGIAQEAAEIAENKQYTMDVEQQKVDAVQVIKDVEALCAQVRSATTFEEAEGLRNVSQLTEELTAQEISVF
mmetsp:Transcript_73569/g.129683  ORF Transcript_73569/g.129683 Transcript_73569/m.129683 type:complete len:795 (-) Transcript_73569:55-2439(-)